MHSPHVTGRRLRALLTTMAALAVVILLAADAPAGPDDERGDRKDRQDLKAQIRGKFVVLVPTDTGARVFARPGSELIDAKQVSETARPQQYAAVMRALAPLMVSSDTPARREAGRPLRPEDQGPAIVLVIPDDTDLAAVFRLMDGVFRAHGNVLSRMILAFDEPGGDGWLLRQVRVAGNPGRAAGGSLDQTRSVTHHMNVVHVTGTGTGRSEMRLDGEARARRISDASETTWRNKLSYVRRDLIQNLREQRELVGRIDSSTVPATRLRDLAELTVMTNQHVRPGMRLHVRWPQCTWRWPDGSGLGGSGSQTAVRIAVEEGQPTMDNFPQIGIVVSRNDDTNGWTPIGRTRHGDRRAVATQLPSWGLAEKALCWLADHQNGDGSWSPDDYEMRGREAGRTGAYANLTGIICRGRDESPMRIAITSLSLLAFLAAGHSMAKEDPYRELLEDGLGWLVEMVQVDGSIGYAAHQRQWSAYAQAFAAWALVDAWYVLQLPWLQGAAQKTIDRIASTQTGTRGRLGWRYGDANEADSSVTGLNAFVLGLARRAKLGVSGSAIRNVEGFFQATIGGPGARRRVQYMEDHFSPDGPVIRPLFSQLQICARIALQADRRNADELREMVDSLTTRAFETLPKAPAPPDPDGPVNYSKMELPEFYQWHFGTLAAALVGGDHFDRWYPAVRNALSATQRLDGTPKEATYGSWDTTSVWCRSAGRVCVTALNSLTLLAPARYPELAIR